MVKHKTKYSCESAIYFKLGPDVIKDYLNIPMTLTKSILLQQYLMEVMRLF